MGTSYTRVQIEQYFDIRPTIWSSGRVLGSRSEGRGFDTRPMLDESGVKDMPG